MSTRRREIDCPVEGPIVLDEACCPTCSRPLEPADGATHTRYGYGDPELDERTLGLCGRCPAVSRSELTLAPRDESLLNNPQVRAWLGECTERLGLALEECRFAYEVTWKDAVHDGETHRTESARRIGWFDAEGELHLDHDPERDAFRVAFPDLCESPIEVRDDRLAFVVLLAIIIILAAVLA